MVTPDITIKALCPGGCRKMFAASWDWDYSDDHGTRMLNMQIEQVCACDVDHDSFVSAAYEAWASAQLARAKMGHY